jgi:outer membrane protein assembly factor BamB
MYEDPRGIAEDEENIYLAGYHSISAWRKSDSTLRVINAKDLLTHGMILYDKKLWLATEGNGMIRMDPANGKYIPLVKDTIFTNNYLISTAVWGDTILIGGYRSFNAYLPAKDMFLNPVIRYDSILVSGLMVKKILPLDGNRCLLGTDKGIFIIRRDFSILQHIRPGDREERPGNDIINDLIWGPDGKIWAATFDGVLCFDASGRLVKSIRRQEGLAGDFVASLAADARGGLWAGTYEGLSRIDTTSGRINNFYKADGLPDDEFNHSSVYVANAGDIVMGTISGFIRFDPRTSRRNSISGNQIRISRAEYGRGENVSVQLDFPYHKQETLRIGPDVKYLKLHFYADPVFMPEQSVFEYKIDGIHERWMKMGPTPILHIDNVRSGKYTLRVRFINGNGSEEILEQRFPLVVEQYFYTQPAFYVAIISTMLIFIILYVRTIMQRDRRLMEVRQELAADLHDEVGGYMAGLLMKIDLLVKAPRIQEIQLSMLRNLATKAVFGLKDGLWSLDHKTDSAQQLWDRYKRIVQESLEPFDIPYKFSSPRGLNHAPLTLIEKRNLLFTLKECLNNAIKHGDGNGVWFEWKISREERHTITIRNGIRRVDREDMMEGLGLENMQRRVSRIRGTLSTSQHNGQFTVEININLRHDHIGRD